ncbi:MAG: cyclic 2,3-diphosphoglycerate synthase [Hyphomicrobiaceae bacterium]|nr:cyclic 2,3-diphosphoglycerate synthase [Hyphomicrobiaceae bacterium]
MARATGPRRIVIMGAAGRDFHNFNVVYRDDPGSEVVAFTAAQIPGIADRRYPPSLAGSRYPSGVPILDETELTEICRRHAVDEVVFAYSDVEQALVMHKASIALAAGADFRLLGPNSTMLRGHVPVIAVCAVRTGVGKSQVARWVSRRLKEHGLRVVAIRHPMPYGNLASQAVQRFACLADLHAAHCTIEEREEYEPHLAIGNLVFAGADYERILEAAEREADVILWDGGNNDFSFIRPDLQIVLVDPLRPGHETTHHPGEAVLRMADVVVVAKSNSANAVDIRRVTETAQALAPSATMVRGASIITLDAPELVRGRRAMAIDDGPTLTHGGMAYGAGYLAAVEAGAAEIVDPRTSATGSIADAFRQFPHIGKVLPALGYSSAQLADLAATINGSTAEVIVSGTPSDLGHLIPIDKPVVRARYEYGEVGEPSLAAALSRFLGARGLTGRG